MCRTRGRGGMLLTRWQGGAKAASALSGERPTDPGQGAALVHIDARPWT
jgi:hypothetical protein